MHNDSPEGSTTTPMEHRVRLLWGHLWKLCMLDSVHLISDLLELSLTEGRASWDALQNTKMNLSYAKKCIESTATTHGRRTETT